jgi:type IV pilus assembly protein PilO
VNDLLNNILERSRKQKIAILAGFIILAGALYFSFLYDPLSNEILQLQDGIEVARNQRTVMAQKAVNLARLQQEIRVMDARLKEAVAQLPNKKEIPDLLSTISTKAREAGLEILLFRPRNENFQDFYAEIPVDIVVRGGFYNAVTFFDEVGKFSRLVNIDNIDFKSPRITGDQVVLDISTLATTFRFLDDAERKKIADEKARAAKK